MAVLTNLPEQSVIAGYKGTVDFYLWMGIPVARKWPRKSSFARSPAVQAQWPAFTAATRVWRTLSPEDQAAYNKMAQKSIYCGRDLQIRSYLKGLFTPPSF